MLFGVIIGELQARDEALGPIQHNKDIQKTKKLKRKTHLKTTKSKSPHEIERKRATFHLTSQIFSKHISYLSLYINIHHT